MKGKEIKNSQKTRRLKFFLSPGTNNASIVPLSPSTSGSEQARKRASFVTNPAPPLTNESFELAVICLHHDKKDVRMIRMPAVHIILLV
ncbi:unnamed protein product [Euphydryas editha]|uniref:Uncharacterized protein n=1 Tax=Euphydryas editha TaxID=104508 RepID=A0AAU9UCD8_EUPED|nr:unnamed protein product [Euphydryas editha]